MPQCLQQNAFNQATAKMQGQKLYFFGAGPVGLGLNWGERDAS